MSTMKYRDLKEMTFKEWDGKPFRAIVIDNPEEDITGYDIKRLNGEEGAVLINGYKNGCWMDDDCRLWIYAYPMEWNKKPKKRMTNRQLMEWLSKGNGMIVKTSIGSVGTYFSVLDGNLDKPCSDEFKVRKWNSEEWIEPTTDLLEEY